MGAPRSRRTGRAGIVVLVMALVWASIPWSAQTSSLSQAASISGLHASGNQIHNSAGLPVRLRGVNRPGTEYACIFNFGIFVGATDAASIQAMLNWKINAVRIPLNEDCWLDVNMAGINPAYRGANYRNAIVDYTTRLTQSGIAVILDLHWAAPGNQQATGQLPMANRDHSIAFWQSVASTFKTNTAVIFDLYNEPFPDNNQDTVAAWTCLRDGSPQAGPTASCPGPYYDGNGALVPSNYAAAGLQELLSVVRNTLATNLVLLAGVAYTGRLKDWITYKPNDPQNNLAASMHIYPPGSQCSNLACWDLEVAPIVAQYPLIAGEIGQDSCAVERINPVIDWLEGKNQHFLAWAWWAVPCAPGNPTYGLITDYSTGAPTAGYGQGYKDRLAAVVANAPGFTTSASVQPAGVAPGGTVTITATVTSATAVTVVVNVYVYDPAGGYTQYPFMNEPFVAGQTRTFPVTWAIPPGAATGLYTVRIGVFDSDWDPLLHWNGNAAQITVAATPPTATRTSSPTATATRTSTPTATAAVGTQSCTPRSNVAVTSASNGDGRLRVTITAGEGSGPNRLDSLQFTRLDNATVEIGSQLGVTGTFNLLPAVQTVTLYVGRPNAGAASTVHVTVRDGCGAWPTFVGGGPGAF
jgi:endoglucanase